MKKRTKFVIVWGDLLPPPTRTLEKKKKTLPISVRCRVLDNYK